MNFLPDNFANISGSCVENVIKFLHQKFSCFLHSTIDNLYKCANVQGKEYSFGFTLMQLSSRYFGTRSSRALAVAGEISLGLRMTALPAAMAGSTGAMVNNNGKFQAPITNAVP